jgi:hypothetical protein
VFNTIAIALLVAQTVVLCSAEISRAEDKKVVSASDTVTTIPPESTDKSEKRVKQESNKSQAVDGEITDKTIPVSARNAIDALKKLMMLCQSGIAHKEFVPALADAKSAVDIFVNSKDAAYSERLKELILKAMVNFQKADDSMRYKIHGVQSLRSRVLQAALQNGGEDSAALLLSPDIEEKRETEDSKVDATTRYIRTASYILKSIDKILYKNK